MIGTDIVKISRIKEIFDKQAFLDKILTASEMEYIKKKSDIENQEGFSPKVMSVAGLFAVKEAVLKSLSLGLNSGFGFKDIEIGHEQGGAPIAELSDKLLSVLHSKNKEKVFVSIAHDGEYAIAVAILH